MNVHEIYHGSDADATRALYAHLETFGPAGRICMNLLRSQKASARAKVYRGGNSGGRYRDQAYAKKDWSIGELCKELERHARTLGILWGWKIDPRAEFHRWVLYVVLPTGQVSFHAEAAKGPQRFAGEWDGARGESPQRIIGCVASLLAGENLGEQMQHAAWIDELARECSCRASNRPCEGLMAGGLCDGLKDGEEEQEDYSRYTEAQEEFQL